MRAFVYCVAILIRIFLRLVAGETLSLYLREGSPVRDPTHLSPILILENLIYKGFEIYSKNAL